MDITARLRSIVERARHTAPYAARLRGVDTSRLSAADLSVLPFTTRADLLGAHAAALTSLHTSEVVQMHLTPAPGAGRMPELLTRDDLAWQAEAVAGYARACGVGPSDRCLVTFSYHMVAGGWLFHDGLVRLGAAVLALGPGEAERAAEIAREYDFNVLVSNPSFARRVGEAGGRFETLLAAGEPFSAVPGLRERTERALGCEAFDAYGLSEAGIVAAETAARDGMREVAGAALLEVVDPAGERLVADGDKGELVVTSLTRTAMPVLRFRTGDLTLKGSVEGRLSLPRGVFGRTDTMIKLKGIKFYPKELAFVLAGTSGVDHRHYQVRVTSRPDGGDRAELWVQRGDGDLDVPALARSLRSATGIRLDDIVPLDTVEGEVLVDERFDADADRAADR